MSMFDVDKERGRITTDDAIIIMTDQDIVGETFDRPVFFADGVRFTMTDCRVIPTRFTVTDVPDIFRHAFREDT